MANKAYKRSWKNYLLDPSYQLRFTLTMIAVAAGLMAPLGWWVSKKAGTATEVALNQIDAIACPGVLGVKAVETGPTSPPESSGEEMLDLLEYNAEDAVSDADAGSAELEGMDEGGNAEPELRRGRRVIAVSIDDSEMPAEEAGAEPESVAVVGSIREQPPTSEQIAASVEANALCLANVTHRRNSVQNRKSLIMIVMLGSGFLLLIGLGVYGIKSTHRVAGPLFKVGLYMVKLENNVYDRVYDLRKGDQLVEFYEHFKAAHKGVTAMQQEDRDRLRDAVELAKEAGLAENSTRLKAAIEDLQRLLAEKEESLERIQS